MLTFSGIYKRETWLRPSTSLPSHTNDKLLLAELSQISGIVDFRQDSTRRPLQVDEVFDRCYDRLRGIRRLRVDAQFISATHEDSVHHVRA